MPYEFTKWGLGGCVRLVERQQGASGSSIALCQMSYEEALALHEQLGALLRGPARRDHQQLLRARRKELSDSVSQLEKQIGAHQKEIGRITAQLADE